MRVVLLLAALCAVATLAVRREPAASRARAEAVRVDLPPVAASNERVAARVTDDPSSEIFAIHESPAVESSLVARLRGERRPAVRLALILALERAGTAASLAELERHMVADDPHRAAAALAAIHAIAPGDRAWRLCDALLRSPELANADPLFFAASRVRARPIELVVREFEDPSYPTAVREQARAWLAERRARPIDDCGCGDHPVPEGRVP